MATTFTSTYNNQEALQKPLIATLSSTNTAEEKFRFILQVFVNGNEIAKIKQQKNTNDDVNIDVWRILESYANPKFVDGSENPIHETIKVTDGGDSVSYIQLKAGEEYAASSTENPTEYLAQDTETFYTLNGVWQFKDGLSPSLTEYVYHDNTDELKYLTKGVSTYKARLEDYGVIAFWNGDLDSPVTIIDNVVIRWKFYNSDGDLIQTSEVNTVDISGDAPPTTITNANRSKCVQFVPFFPANTDGLGAVSIPSATSYYTFDLYDDGGNANWETKTVHLYEDCKYQSMRLGWVNEFDCWDYFNFKLVSQESINVNRKTLTKPFGTWDSTSYTYGNHERGESVFDISADQEYTINSDWLTDEEFTWLKGLLLSKEVQYYDGTDWLAVIITDTNYEVKKSINGKLNNLQLKFKMAHKLR